MARIEGVGPGEGGFFVRFFYWMVKRKIGRVIVPIKLAAHLPRLLGGMGAMEQAQAAIHTVDAKLKSLASIKAATLIGCPF